MKTLVLDGKTFVKASIAAESLGYTADYVGQLCRAGKVPAHLVGRTWYVDQDALGTHRAEKKRSVRAKAREQVRKSLEEAKKETTRIEVTNMDKKAYEQRIKYEEDSEDLIPVVKKLDVISRSEHTPRRQSSKKATHEKKDKEADTENYTIENEGEKILFSGTLDVVDASLEEEEKEGVVHMEAKIEEKKEHPHPPQKKIKNTPKNIGTSRTLSVENSEKEAIVAIHEETTPRRTPFLHKLIEADVETKVVSELEEKTKNPDQREKGPDLNEETRVLMVNQPQITQKPPEPELNRRKQSVFVFIVVVLSCALSATLFLVESGWSASFSEGVTTEYRIDPRDFIEFRF